MYEKSRMALGRAGMRLETQKHQREARGSGFHPRSLARAVAHASAANSEISGINKVHPGQNQSAFAKNWRKIAYRVSQQKPVRQVKNNKH